MSASKLIRRLEKRSSPSAAHGPNAAFTLIELMVVLLLIAILLGIALPTFLGAQRSTQDRSAQADLQNGLNSVKYLFTELQSYQDITLARLMTLDNQVQWCTTCNSGDNAHGTNTHDVLALVGPWSGTGFNGDTALTLAETSASGTCWIIIVHSLGPTVYGEDQGNGCGGSPGYPAMTVCWDEQPPWTGDCGAGVSGSATYSTKAWPS